VLRYVQQLYKMVRCLFGAVSNKNFHFSKSSRPALGFTQPPIQQVPGALSPGVKRLGREADHSLSTSAEVKKMWIYTFTPHTPSWRSAQLVKHRENFILP
jgi:hypothetical protein